MSLESDPILQQGPGFNFGHREPVKPHFKLKFSSPFLPGSFDFSARANAMNIHPMTASILDDMQFLITTVLELSESHSDQEVKKLQSTATWIHDRISKLPKDLSETYEQDIRVDEAEEHQVPASTADIDTESHSAIKPHSLLPQYPEFSSSSASPSPTTFTNDTLMEASASTTAPSTTSPPNTQSTPNDTPVTTTSPSPPPPSQPQPDPLYTAIRLAAPLYARAIATRQSFTKTCSHTGALQILAATWRIPLSRWRDFIGILLFTFISIVSTVSNIPSSSDNDPIAAQLRPHAGFVKSILQIGFMQVSLEDWEVCRETLGRGLGLLGWLSGGIGVGEVGEGE